MTTKVNPIKSAILKEGKLSITLEIDATAIESGDYTGLEVDDSGKVKLSKLRNYANIANVAGLSVGFYVTFNPQNVKNDALQVLLASGMPLEMAKKALGLK